MEKTLHMATMLSLLWRAAFVKISLSASNKFKQVSFMKNRSFTVRICRRDQLNLNWRPLLKRKRWENGRHLQTQATWRWRREEGGWVMERGLRQGNEFNPKRQITSFSLHCRPWSSRCDGPHTSKECHPATLRRTCYGVVCHIFSGTPGVSSKCEMANLKSQNILIYPRPFLPPWQHLCLSIFFKSLERLLALTGKQSHINLWWVSTDEHITDWGGFVQARSVTNDHLAGIVWTCTNTQMQERW